jgi:hypothetical protein
MGRNLDGHPTGNLAHGGKQGQPPVRKLHGLVGDPNYPAPEQSEGEVLVGGQVQEREKKLAGLKKGVFDGLRFLDLDN